MGRAKLSEEELARRANEREERKKLEEKAKKDFFNASLNDLVDEDTLETFFKKASAKDIDTKDLLKLLIDAFNDDVLVLQEKKTYTIALNK